MQFSENILLKLWADSMEEWIKIALAWREQHGYVGKGGIVVLWDGEVQSWCNELRDPGHWQPGCIAINEQGCCWKATLGDTEAGALLWLECS